MKEQCGLVKIGQIPLSHRRSMKETKRSQPVLKIFTHVNKGRTWTRHVRTA